MANVLLQLAGGGPPLIFETMVITTNRTGSHSHFAGCRRYSTLEQALAGHAELVWQKVYRAAAQLLHADAGGDNGDWAKLQDAKALLDGLHNKR